MIEPLLPRTILANILTDAHSEHLRSTNSYGEFSEDAMMHGYIGYEDYSLDDLVAEYEGWFGIEKTDPLNMLLHTAPLKLSSSVQMRIDLALGTER